MDDTPRSLSEKAGRRLDYHRERIPKSADRSIWGYLSSNKASVKKKRQRLMAEFLSDTANLREVGLLYVYGCMQGWYVCVYVGR